MSVTLIELTLIIYGTPIGVYLLYLFVDYLFFKTPSEYTGNKIAGGVICIIPCFNYILLLSLLMDDIPMLFEYKYRNRRQSPPVTPLNNNYQNNIVIKNNMNQQLMTLEEEYYDSRR